MLSSVTAFVGLIRFFCVVVDDVPSNGWSNSNDAAVSTRSGVAAVGTNGRGVPAAVRFVPFNLLPMGGAARAGRGADAASSSSQKWWYSLFMRYTEFPVCITPTGTITASSGTASKKSERWRNNQGTR